MRLHIYIFIITGVLYFLSCVTPLSSSLNYSSEKKSCLSSDKFIWPVKGKIISDFGQPRRTHSLNKGIDILTSLGAKVRAASGGKVIFLGKIRGLGLTIIISHPQGYLTVYGNNLKSFVSENQVVSKGELISLVGPDPWLMKPVLHFEIRKKDKALNPKNFLR